MSSWVPSSARRRLARAFAWAAPSPDGLRILTYHRVNRRHPRDRLTVHPDALAAQMELLARSDRVVALRQVLSALRGEAALAPGSIAITFDDGFADNHSDALPVLGRFGFPATFFLPTAYIGSEATLDRYSGCCGDDRMMDWEQARALRDRGHEIGGHGHRHRELGALPAEDARAEIETCASAIGSALGTRPRSFCYPRGSDGPGAKRLLAAAGFEAACTVRPGVNRVGADLLARARTEVSGDDTLEDFELKLAGGFDAWHRILQRAQAWGHR